MRQTMILAGLVVGSALLGVQVLGRGEVATLTTVAVDGSRHETPVWVVEIDRTYYLRAGSPEAGWLERLRRYPQIELEVGGVARSYRARPLDGGQERNVVNRAMAEKYGLADWVVGLLIDRGDSVPIRLRPSDTEP